jgi:hypothetical protein
MLAFGRPAYALAGEPIKIVREWRSPFLILVFRERVKNRTNYIQGPPVNARSYAVDSGLYATDSDRHCLIRIQRKRLIVMPAAKIFRHVTAYQEIKWTHQYEYMRRCPLCESWVLKTAFEYEHLGREHENEVRGFFCAVCGYWELLGQEWGQQDYLENERFFEARLEKFGALEKAIPSLIGAVKRISERCDLYQLTPRQFEQLSFHYVSDVFDCEPVMTKQTRDGGYDLSCFDSENGPFIVECKKYERVNVGVNVVRQLVGVQVLNGIPKALIVTTGRVTRDALREQKKLNTFTHYHLDVHDIDDLMAWLQKKAQEPVTLPVIIPVRQLLGDSGFLFDSKVQYLIYDPRAGTLNFDK